MKYVEVLLNVTHKPLSPTAEKGVHTHTQMSGNTDSMLK